MGVLKTPEDFVQKYNGKSVDYDGAYGVQCVDGFKIGCAYLSIPVAPTPNNWADGYWTGLNANGTPNKTILQWQAKYFEKVKDPNQFRNGDWVVWGRNGVSPSHPSSHIAMWFNKQEFGENQGGNGGFCLKSTDFSDALGALRPKAWGGSPSVEIPYGASVIEMVNNKYSLYRQNPETEDSAVLSAGLNKVLPISKLDAEVYVMAKATGANYCQMRDDVTGQPKGMTFGDISSPLNDVWRQLPNQDTTLYYDLETGVYGDCTGISINKEHNVFSPAVVYPETGNYQYARMVGISHVNVVSRYTFSIRLKDGSYVLGLALQDCTPKQIAEDFKATIAFHSIAFLDGGGSAQFGRWDSSKGKFEYVRDTGRPCPSAVAIISKKPLKPSTETLPLPPVQEDNANETQQGAHETVIPLPTSPETGESEEEPMSENKPAESPETKPVEGWTDPEPQTGIIKERVAALLSVKSILTLALTVIFGYLVVNQIVIPDLFNEIYKIVILFFFGYQTGKAAGK